MDSRPGLTIYILLVFSLGAGLLAYTLPTLPPETLPLVAFLSLLCAGAQSLPVSLFHSSSISVALAFPWVAMMLGGPAAAILVNVPSIFVHAVYPKQRAVRKVTFNLGITACAAGTAGLVYQAAGGTVPVGTYQAGIVPLGAAAICYYVIDCVGVALAVSLAEGRSFLSLLRGTYLGLLPHYLAIAGISLGMALAYQTIGLVGMLLFGLPLVMAWQSFKAYSLKSAEARARSAELSETEHLLDEVVRSALGRVVQPVSLPQPGWDPSQMELAMEYAAETARRLGLDEATVATARLAALLHDLGQALLPEAVLNKRGPLDDSERALIQGHPRLGAQLVREIAHTPGLAEAILHHHERFDGAGYPSRLAGPAVPIAAQIVGVVEAYQAMTAKRAFRGAFSPEEAMERLLQSAGSQFNPAVVEAFSVARSAVASARAQRRRAAMSQAFAQANQPRSRALNSRLAESSVRT